MVDPPDPSTPDFPNFDWMALSAEIELGLATYRLFFLTPGKLETTIALKTS